MEGTAFLGDVIEVVNDCFRQGFDHFQTSVNEDHVFGLSVDTKVKMLEDIEGLYEYVQDALDSNLADWEQDALRRTFALPPVLLLPPSQAAATTNGAVYDPSAERALDAELQHLREEIEKTTASSTRLKQQLHAVDREVSRCRKEAESLKSIVKPAAGDVVGETARQVASMAARLQPLLAKAEQLRRQRRGPLSKLRDGRPAFVGSDRDWLEKLQVGGPEDIARLRSTFGVQPANSSRSEQDSKSQASVQQ